MKSIFFCCILLGILTSCQKNQAIPENSDVLPSIQGTWKLLSGMTIQGTDTTFSDYTLNQESFKIIQDHHFAFLRHDLRQGKDSTALFVSGGGRYTLENGTYTEYLDYCNFREWEGHQFEFTLEMRGDTLIQKGVEKVAELGVDRLIWEYYLKMEGQ